VAGAGRRPVRPDVASSDSLTPLSKIKLIKYEEAWVGANRARIMAKWNELVMSKK
jgi:hypothetical protein